MKVRAGGRQHGFAVVTVLWAGVIFAIIVASVMQLSRTDAKLSHVRQESAESIAVTDAAIHIAILRMLGVPAMQPPVDNTSVAISFAGREVRVSVQDESGKIDLNMAGETILHQVLGFAGLDEADVGTMTDRILDWRNNTPRQWLNGAKVDDYLVAGLPYAPREGPFRSVSELRLVSGMTQVLYSRLAPMLTVYSQSAWIDPTFAPPEVLGVLAGIDGGAAATLARGGFDGTSARPNPPQRGVAAGHAYTITARLDGPGEARINRIAVVRLTGWAHMPVWVYQWR